MKVAYINIVFLPNLEYGGPTTVTFNIAKQLPNDKYSTVVLTTDISSFGSRTRFERGLSLYGGVNVIRFHSMFLLKKFAFVFSFPLILWVIKNRKEYSIFHISYSREMIPIITLISLIISGHKGVVLHTHGMLTTKNRVKMLIDRKILRYFTNKAKAAIALQQEEMEYLKDINKNIVIINNAIDIHGNVELESNKRGVLFMSRLHKNKRPDLFLSAAEILIEQGFEDNFYIAGPDGGELEEIMIRLADQKFRGKLKYVGNIPYDEVQNLMKKMRLYVLPSDYESFGMTLIESMSVGTPVVVTPGVVISADIEIEKAGVVADSNPEELSRKIRELYFSDEYDEYSVNAFNYVKKNFDIESMINKMRNLYES